MNTELFDSNFKSLLPQLVGIKFYKDSAPSTATLPYTIFRYETTIDTSPSQVVSVKFICHDATGKTSKDNMIVADKIQKLFNKNAWVLVGQGLHSTMSLRQEIPREMLVDTQVIELQFDIEVYEKEEE